MHRIVALENGRELALLAPQLDDGEPRRWKFLRRQGVGVAALYARPAFTPDEQQHYFTLTPAEQAACAELRSRASQVGFILQLGYFKARQLFFAFSFADVADDAAAILSRHFSTAAEPAWEPLSEPTIRTQRTRILELLGYRRCRVAEREQAALHARKLAQISSKPVYVFRELLQFFAEQRIVVPGYTVMQNLVSQAVTFEQQRLITILQNALTAADMAALDALLAQTDERYQITWLKQEPADMTRDAMGEEIERATLLRPLAALAERIIPALDISREAVAYYASLINYYAAGRLLQLDRWVISLYLLCFVHHRSRRCNEGRQRPPAFPHRPTEPGHTLPDRAGPGLCPPRPPAPGPCGHLPHDEAPL